MLRFPLCAGLAFLEFNDSNTAPQGTSPEALSWLDDAGLLGSGSVHVGAGAILFVLGVQQADAGCVGDF
jgi:hypothetical protein